MDINVENNIFWGRAEKTPNGKDEIVVYGNKTGDSFERINQKDTKSIFPPYGKVFSPSPLTTDGYYIFKAELDQRRNGNQKRDDYIIIGSAKPIIFFHYCVFDGLSDEWHYALKQIESNMINSEDGTYFIQIDKEHLVGPLRKTSQGIQPTEGKEAGYYEITDEILFYQYILDNKYCLFTFPSPRYVRPRGKIDYMTDNQIQEWFKDKVKNAKNISLEEYENITGILKRIKSFSANELDSVRFERIESIINDFDFSYRELKDLCASPGPVFQDLSKRLEYYKNEIRDDLEGTFAEQKEAHNFEIISLENRKTALISELDKILENKKFAEEELNKIAEKEIFVKNNFDSLILSLQIQSGMNIASNKQKFIPKPFCIPRDGKPLSELIADGYDLENVINRNIAPVYQENSLEIICNGLRKNSPIFSAQAVFLPSISWAFIYALAIGNAKVFTLHIEHDWLHYSDFCEHGLLDICNQANNDPETNYIMILQDLNLTQPECGLRPFLDCIAQNRPVIEGLDYGVPANTKIFATVIPETDDKIIGLKLSKRLFDNWSFFGNENIDNTIPVKMTYKTYGYCYPSDIAKLLNADNHGEQGVYFPDE